MRGKQKGFVSLHGFLYLVLVLRAGLQLSVGQFWPVDRRFDVPAVACSHGHAACLTLVCVVRPQQPVRCLKDLEEQRVSALMWLSLPPLPHRQGHRPEGDRAAEQRLPAPGPDPGGAGGLPGQLLLFSLVTSSSVASKRKGGGGSDGWVGAGGGGVVGQTLFASFLPNSKLNP